ncbi:MAG: SprB repeat-containing protein [Lewinellaceae bacterium]|nr:SprB repeat-containing protein [Lewinellaceae bacterium]
MDRRIASATVGTEHTHSKRFLASSGTCAGQASGSATVSFSGGTMPYVYLWTNGQSGLQP